MSVDLDTVAAGVVVFDGGTGTTFQRASLTADDFGGPEFEGCNELLNVTRPDIVAELHQSFFDAGVDVVETNTFGAFAVPLDEYGIGDRAYELTAGGAEIAREVADRSSTSERRRWVAGSMGPGTKLASLGQVTYATWREAYEVQAAGLIDGGVDLLIIETQFDLLTVKAAVTGARRAMRHAGRDVPLQAQVTIELSGRMLPGTEIGAALTAIEALGGDIIGLNCATGPEEMDEHLRYLSHAFSSPGLRYPERGAAGGRRRRDGVRPECGLAGYPPRNLRLGVWSQGRRRLLRHHPRAHPAVVDHCRELNVAPRHPSLEPAATSIYSSVPFRQDTSFLIIGERTNANGSKTFRDAMLAGDLDACLGIGRSQVAESAHLVDVCVDYVGRDGAADMDALAARFATQVAAPIVLDTTEPEVMQAGLERLGGRCVLNSANLEDGDAHGSRVDRVFGLAQQHGAAVICLLIDEDGQARDVEWKLNVAHRLHDLAVNRYGLESTDLLFDPLTFPLTTGDEDLRRDAMATIEAMRRIKVELPGVFTVLGISNVSFGLKPAARHVLNSVFLHECVEAGLDAAIVHAAKIVPLHQIDPDHRRICLDLIYDRRGPGYDPLTELLDAFEDVGRHRPSLTIAATGPWSGACTIASSMVTCRASTTISRTPSGKGEAPLEIINDILLAGMKEVGERFASGDMQLPFVLRSAETMKAAVGSLEPLMERADGGRGSIVLATVHGDVHDIGKNLVDIILSNNGFDVHNLGIKVGVNELIDALRGARRRCHRDERLAGQEHVGDARQPRRAQPSRPQRRARCSSEGLH